MANDDGNRSRDPVSSQSGPELTQAEEPVTSPADASVQQAVEPLIVKDIGSQLRVELKGPARFDLPGGSHVDVDAAQGSGTDAKVLVEAYAACGKLEAGRRRKVAVDALKLLSVRQSGACHPDARLIIAVADDEARDSIQGWLRGALEAFDVEVVAADLPEQVRDALRARSKQYMKNIGGAGAE
jgi:hypothetical protein